MCCVVRDDPIHYIVMNGVISDHTAHIYLAQDPSVTTSSGAFCGDYTTYSTSVLSKRTPRWGRCSV